MIAISVILPTYNRLSQLQTVLSGLAAQTYPADAFELIVVSDGATDGTNDFLSTLQTPYYFKPILQQNQGAAAARNTGIAAAAGEYVLFIDDDVVPGPDLIQEHMHFHQAHGDNLVVLGPMLTPTDYKLMPWVAWEQEMLYKQYDAMQQGRWQPTARQFYTGNTSLARKYLLKAGGFDTQFRRAEDVELAYRLMEYDLQFVFAPRAIGYHYADRSFRSWMATPYAYGRNDVIFTLKKGHSWLLPTIMAEFRLRNSLIQTFTCLHLDRSLLSWMSVLILRIIAQLTSSIGLKFLPRIVFSAIFNLRYYQGIADELGGRDRFFLALNR